MREGRAKGEEKQRRGKSREGGEGRGEEEEGQERAEERHERWRDGKDD